jgi:hypothetical protein
VQHPRILQESCEIRKKTVLSNIEGFNDLICNEILEGANSCRVRRLLVRRVSRNTNYKLKTELVLLISIRFNNTYLLTYGAEPFLRSCQLCNHPGNSQNFKEPEGSSPYSQDPYTCSYPESDSYSLYHPILSLLGSITILSTQLRLDLPSGLFHSGFPTNILYVFPVSPIRATITTIATIIGILEQ